MWVWKREDLVIFPFDFHWKIGHFFKHEQRVRIADDYRHPLRGG